MEQLEIKRFAKRMNNAEESKRDVTRITLEYPQMTVDDGYKIQREIIKIKMHKGHHIVGVKMGFTSEAKMVQMKIDKPIYGYLFDYMRIENGASLSINELIHPRVESEIAFIMKKDLEGDSLSIEEIMDAVDYVVPVMEIVDSRYENFNFNLPDVLADNSSSSRFVVGNHFKKPEGLHLERLKVFLSINDDTVDQGVGAAVLGHPANSVSMLANMLSKIGGRILAGQIILTGGITKAIPFKSGDTIKTEIEGIGSAAFNVVD